MTRFLFTAVVAVLQEHPVGAAFENGDLSISFQQPVVFRRARINHGRIPEQPADSIQRSQRLKAVGGKGHFIDGIFVVKDVDHPVIEDLQKGVRNPVIRVGQIGFIEVDSVQEGAQRSRMVFLDVQEEGPRDATADFLIHGRTHAFSLRIPPARISGWRRTMQAAVSQKGVLSCLRCPGKDFSKRKIICPAYSTKSSEREW